MDAPHTGARLETGFFPEGELVQTMPPTRGHDLKPVRVSLKRRINMMPPTRGHDLKLHNRSGNCGYLRDAPHTGARLETHITS